ncbi:MAG: hypothetical protein J6W92_04615 [Paludibacteraceae bacterium]|nr:hypothetical protein [Paludibacteraceae bacterium]
MTYKFSSSEASLLANGHAADILTPWNIEIDTDEQTITVSKRNKYLIGVDEDSLAFRFIRRVVIDQHLIGADITIQAVGGKLTAKCLDKSACKRIKQILMEYNEHSKTNHNIFS